MKAVWLGLWFSLTPAVAADQLAWPELPITARFEQVLDSSVISGWPARVRRFQSPQSPHEVLMKIESAWRARRSPVLRTQQGPWEILSSWSPDQVSNVQVRADRRGGSEGLVSIWSSQPQPGADDAVRALLPEGARVLRLLQSRDGDREAQSVVATVDASPGFVRLQTTERLRGAGFRSALSGDESGLSGARFAAVFRDASRELLLTIMPLGTQTGLVIHLRSEAP